MKKPSRENTNSSAGKFAKEKLEEKYSCKFEITDLSKYGNGPFKSKEYVGYAYLPSNYKEKFTIWVDQTENKVIDSYECIRINKIANGWLQSYASSVWKDAQLDFWSLLVSEPTEVLSKYSKKNIRDYFTNEFSYNEITILLPELSDNEAEKIDYFLDEISGVSNGAVYITYLDKKEKGQLVIDLAFNITDIEKQIDSWEGN